MAVIRKFTEGRATTRVHPTETDAVVHIVQPAKGAALLQISTFGSDDRLSDPKVSQTIQLDSTAALALCAFTDKAFGPIGEQV